VQSGRRHYTGESKTKTDFIITVELAGLLFVLSLSCPEPVLANHNPFYHHHIHSAMKSNSSIAVFVSTQGFNSLTLFATDHWSWHFVEPVWEHQAEGGDASCPGDGQHRFAWSGWYEYKTGGSKDALAAASSSGLSRREMAAQKEKADAVQRDAELQWLKVWDVTLLFVFVSRSADENEGLIYQDGLGANVRGKLNRRMVF